ncbi:MAG: energy-coupling factor transporter transmembrane component T, partial [Bacillota bacterium]|nr:energy-coupling factor transporter transmembrane component T [Bacillota bacterium]
LLPVFAIVSLINPLINGYGNRVLFTWLGGRPYTLEALCYGMALGGIFVSIILWFASYNVVMTSDKFMYIFGGRAPSITLTLTMVLRFVPNLMRKAKQIASARECIGKGSDSPSKGEKVRNGMEILSALTSWALEGGILTADSMRSRGYGVGKRTSFSIYRFDKRDLGLVIVMIFLVVFVVICSMNGATETTYTPVMKIGKFDNIYSIGGIVAYALFLSIPTVVNVLEEIRWHNLRSRI